MSPPDDVVFLFDVDNTLVDNDRVQADLRDHLAAQFGEAACDRYWEILEALRSELGYVDYLGALERYRLERQHDPRLQAIDDRFAGNRSRSSSASRPSARQSSSPTAMRSSSRARWSAPACGRQ